MFKRITCLAVLSSSLLVAGSVWAQDEEEKDYVIKKDVATDDEDEKKEGVEWRINSGATLSFSDNRTVVGQQDGSTLTFGFKFDGALNYYDDPHELRNSLGIVAGVTRTPTVPEFLKSQDAASYESIYLYHIVDWFGVFGRVAWDAPMFRGTDIRALPTDYSIARLDGTTDNVLAQRLTLTDSLKPSRFKQSLGLFVQPIAIEPVTVEARLGAGGRETLAKGQLAINDDDTTPAVVEVKELDDVLQFGAEGVLEVWGSAYENRLTYKAGVEAMTPFVHNDLPAGDTRNAWELTNVLIKAGLSFKLVEWASLDYEFKALREPQLLDDWQISNQLLLTFGFAAGSAKEAPAAE